MAAQFIPVPKATLIQMAGNGPLPAGNIYFCQDTGECFFSVTGAPGVAGNLYPLTSIVLTGTIQAPTGAQGEQGPQGIPGPAGPALSPEQLAMIVALS